MKKIRAPVCECPGYEMKRVDSQEIIVVHCHFFAGSGQTALVNHGLEMLRHAGLAHMAVMGLVNTSLNAQDV